MPLTSYTSKEVLLTERRRLERPLLVLLWVGMAAFCLAEGSLLFLFLSSLAVGANWLVVRENKEIYVSRFWVNLAVAVATVLLFAVLSMILTRRSGNILVIIGRYTIFIQCCKLFEKKRTRDYVQLLVLNLLIVVAGGLLCAQFWYAPLTLLYMFLLCYVGMIFTLKRGLDAVADVQLPTEPAPLSPRRVAWNVTRQWPDQTLRKTLYWILVPSLVGGIFAFLLMPRTMDPRWSPSVQQQMVFTGLSPNMHLTGQTEIYESDRVTMRVRFLREDQPVPAPTPALRYLRGYVLNQYRNSSWTNRGGSSRFHSLRHVPDIPPWMKRSLTRLDVEYLPSDQDVLVTPYPTVEIQPRDDMDVQVSADLEYNIPENRSSDRNPRYTGWVMTEPIQPMQRQMLTRLQRGLGQPTEMSTVVMEPDDRRQVEDLARQWCEDLLERREANPGDQAFWNYQIAQRIAGQLRQEYPYTLDLTESDPSRDAVVDFLFYLRKGHCEYFASSMAVMCSLLDVPVRVATGFAIHEYVEHSHQYIVRERDAHAWCEVYRPDTGWTVLDPTPASSERATGDRSFWEIMKTWYEDLRVAWFQHILGYDTQTQKNIMERLYQWFMQRLSDLEDLVLRLVRSLRNLLMHGVFDSVVMGFLVFLLSLTGILSLILVARRVLRVRRRRFFGSPGELLEPLHRFVKAVEKRGPRRDPSQTLLEWTREVESRYALPAGDLAALVRLHQQWRWGRQALSNEQITRARNLAADLVQYLNSPRQASGAG